MAQFIAPKDITDSLQLQALQKGQQVRCRVSSGSMRPTFDIGDLLIVDGQRPGVGDVALFLLESHWVTHRVIEINDGVFHLRGDALYATNGEEIEESQIIGRVISHHRDRRAYQIRLFQQLLRQCPTEVRKALGLILPSSIKRYIKARALVDVQVISE
ncbi:MAG: hypothetical protein HOK97_08520 [Deltaproteobacteria bacterium]|jgi:signal peptidase I|nr:hypothetical protein [Deltaproteobacteria bacterium]MBT6489792.1 hypothetical protein [Deltaproteobacteria bacterium]